MVQSQADAGYFSDLHGQHQYENTVADHLKPAEENMCWIQEWYQESWPLEDGPGNSSFEHVASQRGLRIEMEEPEVSRHESVLVFADQASFCKCFLDAAPPQRVGHSHFEHMMPGQPPDVEHIKEVLRRREWDLVIFGSGIDQPRSSELVEVLSHADDVARLYLELAKLVQQNARHVKRLAVLTRDVLTEDAKTHRKAGLGIVASSTLWGMTNCIRVELEDIPMQYIDFDWKPSDATVAQVASDLFCLATFGCNTLRILNDGRFVLRQVLSKDYAVSQRPFEVPGDGVIAVTGGNGSLAQVFALHLLEQAERRNQENPDLLPCRFHLKMLSRSGMVRDREADAWRSVQRKAQQLGMTVEQVQCDVSSRDAVDEFIAANSPNVSGVVHTAGVLQDALLRGQTWEKMEVTLAAKSKACLYLHDSLERHANPLELFWTFSSNSIYGNAGQVNYAGANNFLDGICRHRAALGKPGIAIQWGAWGEAGMAAAMNEQMKAAIMMSHMPFFTNEEGFAGMYAGIKSGVPVFAVYRHNPEVMLMMSAPADTAAQRYNRNFTSEFCPTPPPRTPPAIKSKDLYSLYRMARRLIIMYPNPVFEGRALVREKFTKPMLAAEEEEEQLW